MNAPTRRREALEAIARNTLKAYNPDLITGEPQAVPIEKIIEQHLGLSMEFHCLRKNGVILGCTIFDGTLLPVYDEEIMDYTLIPVERGKIFLDESLLEGASDGRLRFTCAHEAAHWMLDKEVYAGTGRAAAHVNPKTSLEENPVIERQADILASALLMPTGQVKKAFYRIHTRYHRDDIIRKLSDLFKVSKQAMGIFLRDHNMA